MGSIKTLSSTKQTPVIPHKTAALFFNRRLPVVNISNKRNGLRKLDLDKPAVVMDAYEAFNLISDYGLNGGKHDWRTFSRQLAFATVGDMGLDRRYFIQEQYDGKPLNLKINQGTDYRKALKNAQMGCADRSSYCTGLQQLKRNHEEIPPAPLP